MSTLGDALSDLVKPSWEVPEASVLRVGGPATPLGRVRLAVISPQEPAMTSAPYRRFESYSLAIVLGGQGVYRDEAGPEREVGPGSALLVWPEVPHWYGPPAGTWAEVYVVFDGPIFDLLARTVPRFRPGVHGPLDGAAWLERLLRVIRTPPPSDEGEALAEVLAFAGLLVELGAAGPDTPQDPVAAALRVLADDLAASLPLPEVARRVGLGYESFRHRFTAAAGMPPARYRDQRRIAAAAELLRSTRLPQREIAVMLGFADEYHFSKRFRQLAGTPPGALRQRQG